MLIGLYSSFPQQGKSTVGDMLEQQLIGRGEPVERISFAEPFYAMVDTLLSYAGLNKDRVAYYLSPAGKDEQIPEIGRSARYLLRTVSTEWGRELVRKDLWVDMLSARTERADGIGAHVVIDDLRVQPEYDSLRSADAMLWKVSGRGSKRAAEHVTDAALETMPFDAYIANDGSLQDLAGRVFGALQAQFRPHPLQNERRVGTGAQASSTLRGFRSVRPPSAPGGTAAVESLPALVGVFPNADSVRASLASNLIAQAVGEEGGVAQRMSSDEPLFAMLRTMFRYADLAEDRIDHYFEDANRGVAVEGVGRSVEYLLNTLESNWGSACLHPQIWDSILASRAKAATQAGVHVVLENLRTRSHQKAILELGGVALHIGSESMLGMGNAGVAEPSEAARVVSTAGDFQDFKENLLLALVKQQPEEELMGPAAG